MSGSAFALHIPATADHVGTARSFAVALLRELGASQERVLDAKLAVSEACSDAVLALGGAGRIALRATVGDGRLQLEIDAPGRTEPSGIADTEIGDQIGRVALIRSLFPDAEVVAEATGAILRFSIPLD
ncbi:MAG: ATP-binding protein [Candidatus Velamenicoccus archaeovorus]